MSGLIVNSGQIKLVSGVEPDVLSDGQMWNDSTNKSLIYYTNGLKQYPTYCIYNSYAQVVVTNTTTQTSLKSATALINSTTVPANFFIPGKSIRWTLNGTCGSSSGTDIQYHIHLFFGNVQLSGFTSTTVAVNTTYHWKIDVISVIQGATSLYSSGIMTLGTISNRAVISDSINAASTISTSIENILDAKVTMTGLGSGNTITCDNFIIEVIG